jgi:hypothetical protein
VTEPRHHVLLIGIDAYDGGGSLTGCVNDIDAIQAILIDRVGIAASSITRLAAPHLDATHDTRIPEQLPTLANLRAAFDVLGGDAVAPEDRVLVYYSGHGTRCIVDDGKTKFAREALLPKDKLVAAERRFLFDWELNELVARIAARTPRVTVILDCCSSGGVTRAPPAAAGTRDRFWPTDDPVVMPAIAPVVARGLGRLDHCQIVAACRDDQRARESISEAQPHGELTRALVRALGTRADLATVAWGDIWREVESGVRATNPLQDPWLSGGFGRRVFGFEPDLEGDRGWAIVAAPAGYTLDVGELHGVTVGAEVAVYGAEPAAFPPLDTAADLEARHGQVRVIATTAVASTAQAVQPFDLPQPARARLIAPGPDSKLRVRLDPPDPALAADLEQSRRIEIVVASEDVAVLRCEDQSYRLVDDIHGATDPSLPSFSGPAARAVLDHYASYIAPVQLARRCRDLPDVLCIDVLDATTAMTTAASAQDPALPQIEPGGGAPAQVGTGALVCFAVENRSDLALSVSLVRCSPDGTVAVVGTPIIAPGGRHVYWSGETLGAPFLATIPDGVGIAVERLVAIGTTSEHAAFDYLQSVTGFRAAATRAPVLRAATEPAAPLDRWTAVTTSLRIIRTS